VIQSSSFPDVQLHIVDAPLGAGPESITPIRGYGFSDVQLHIIARSPRSRPGMTGNIIFIAALNLNVPGRYSSPGYCGHQLEETPS
jgi:hypothetical protein